MTEPVSGLSHQDFREIVRVIRETMRGEARADREVIREVIREVVTEVLKSPMAARRAEPETPEDKRAIELMTTATFGPGVYQTLVGDKVT